VSKLQFFTFIFAVLLHCCSCYVVQGRSTWYVVPTIFEVFRSQASSYQFGTKVVFCNLLPKPKLHTKFKIVSFNGCGNK